MRKPPVNWGNDFNKRLKTQELKDKVYADFCDHLAKGKHMKTWHYDKDGIQLCWQAMETYIRNDPDVDPSKKEIARSKGLAIWDKVCEEGATMKQKVDTATLQLVMRNKFGWDEHKKKEDDDSDSTPTYNVNITSYSKNPKKDEDQEEK